MTLLIDHALGTPRPSAGEQWRAADGSRVVVIDGVHDGYVDAHNKHTNRRTTIQLTTLVSRYRKVPS